MWPLPTQKTHYRMLNLVIHKQLQDIEERMSTPKITHSSKVTSQNMKAPGKKLDKITGTDSVNSNDILTTTGKPHKDTKQRNKKKT